MILLSRPSWQDCWCVEEEVKKIFDPVFCITTRFFCVVYPSHILSISPCHHSCIACSFFCWPSSSALYAICFCRSSTVGCCVLWRLPELAMIKGCNNYLRSSPWGSAKKGPWWDQTGESGSTAVHSFFASSFGPLSPSPPSNRHRHHHRHLENS